MQGRVAPRESQASTQVGLLTPQCRAVRCGAGVHAGRRVGGRVGGHVCVPWSSAASQPPPAPE